MPAATVASVAAEYGLTGPELAVLPGGSVNHTVRVSGGGRSVVVRVHRDPERESEFGTEAWCSSRARRVGVPTPRVLGIGTVDGVPHEVQEHIHGTAAAAHGEVWGVLGRWSAVIASIPVTDDAPAGLFGRFGRDLRSAWNAHVADNRDRLGAADPLVDLDVYPVHLAPDLDRLLAWLTDCPLPLGLGHGDLTPRNVIISDDGPVLIDWGSATTGPAPWTDLLHVLDERRSVGGPDADDVDTYLRAAGVVGDVSTTVVALRVLRDLDLVRWAIDRRPAAVREKARRARRSVREWARSTEQRPALPGGASRRPTDRT